MQAASALFDIGLDNGVLKMDAKGDWRARNLGPIDGALRDFEDDSTGRDIVIDVSNLEKLDTAGAMVLQRIFRACTKRTEVSKIIGASPAHAALLEQVADHLAPCAVEPAGRNAFLMMMNRLGKGVIERDIEQRHPDPHQPLYLYCGGGFRSALAALALQQMGYTQVISVDGGWAALRELLPTVT